MTLLAFLVPLIGFPLAAVVDGFPQRPQRGPPCHEFELGENERKEGSVETPLISASQLHTTKARLEPESLFFSKVGCR